jgi:hypothetical protein
MRLTGLPEELRRRGLVVVTHGEWRKLGSSSFDPKGVVIHHTGPWKTVQGMVDLCIRGRSDLAGPLCQVLLGPDGTCHIIASGRANHAGEGSWRGLHGNSSVVGIEAVHAGLQGVPWPEAQRKVFPRAAAAICELIAAPADMVCAHREWTTRKPDPVSIDMTTFRLQVAALLAEWARPPVEMKVSPRMNFAVIGNVVDALKAPGGGVWVLTDIGAVYAFECDDIDAPNRHPEYWQPSYRAARLEPLGEGYTVVRDNGSRYDYGA